MRIVFAVLALFLVSRELSALEVTNHKNGSVVRYPVVLLRGTYSKSISIETSGVANQSTVTHEGRFKALVSLSEGENQITLKSNGEEQAFLITYRPQKNPYYVRVIWLTDKSADTSYATPMTDVPQDYVGRLRTAAQLMQTFTAERMGDLAFGKKTFRLERVPDNHEIVIHTLKGPLSAEEYYELGDTNQYWSSIRQWLNREYPDPFAKNIVLAAFTRKDPGTGKMKGHTALGGGDLGLFGSASVFTWPISLADVESAFSNFEIVDPKKVHNDGAGRDTYWGVASTTIF